MIFGCKMLLTFLCIDKGKTSLMSHDIQRNSDPRCSYHYGKIQCKIGLHWDLNVVIFVSGSSFCSSICEMTSEELGGGGNYIVLNDESVLGVLDITCNWWKIV